MNGPIRKWTLFKRSRRCRDRDRAAQPARYLSRSREGVRARSRRMPRPKDIGSGHFAVWIANHSRSHLNGHPRLHLRRFVLVPLVELDPSCVHPELGATVKELLDRLPPSRMFAVSTRSPDRGMDRVPHATSPRRQHNANYSICVGYDPMEPRPFSGKGSVSGSFPLWELCMRGTAH